MTATSKVLLILRHFRTSLVIAVTLPMATLIAFLCLWLLRQLGWADVQTNIMSLAGIAISIGVLVDASIVMAENVMHALKNHFGDEPQRRRPAAGSGRLPNRGPADILRSPPC